MIVIEIRFIGVFPTHVGMNPALVVILLLPYRIPHARGDEPLAAAEEKRVGEYSPRTWG